jgi:hypothetical protein
MRVLQNKIQFLLLLRLNQLFLLSFSSFASVGEPAGLASVDVFRGIGFRAILVGEASAFWFICA